MAEPLRVGGLDPSLTSFAMAVAGDRTLVPLLYRIKPKTSGHERLDELLEAVTDYTAGCDVVLVEGILGGMPGVETHLNLAGLHWLVRHRLWELRIPYAVVTPATRQKWLLGKPQREKDICLVTAIKRFGLLFPGGDADPDAGGERYTGIDGNDKADALTLAAMGCAYYGQPLVPMPADRAEVLTATKLVKRGGKSVRVPAVDWPRLDLVPG